VPLNFALIISVAVFIVFLLGVVKMINARKFGTLLIETETEMKKVTWPSLNESFNSSVIVLVAVIFFLAFFLASDFCLMTFFSNVVFGG
jgi:preprotein translocase SecE subunit